MEPAAEVDIGALCPFLQREGFFEIAGNLDIADLVLLRSLCTACAEWAGDATLNSAHIAREGWTADFNVFCPCLAGVLQSKPFEGSVEARYCRRRLQMRLLTRALPEILQTWHIGTTSIRPWLAPRYFAAALAAWLQEGDAIAEAICHLVGDLVEMLVIGELPWRCGPWMLFDRFDCIRVNTFHDVDLVIEMACDDKDADESVDSDDEDPCSVHRFPAALADWNRDNASDVRQCFVGQELKLLPESDAFALRPIPVSNDDGLKQSIALVSRGQNTFADKLQNVEASGAVGAIVYNNQEGALFRMAGNPSDGKILRPALLVSQSVGLRLSSLLNQGRAVVRGLEQCRKPRHFVCIGGSVPRGSAEGVEIWIASDPRADNLGHVLLVPPEGPATVLAHSLFDFLCDIVRLDQQNAAMLKRNAPNALKLLQGGGRSQPPSPQVQSSTGFVDLLSLLGGSVAVNDGLSGAWNTDRNGFCVRLPQRIQRSWLSIDEASGCVETLRMLRPLTDMGLETILAASDTFADDSHVYVSASTADVFVLPCILVEEQAERQQTCTQKRVTTCRRGFRGAAAIFQRIQRIAPDYVKQRWKSMPCDGGRVASCEVSFRGGQLCVRWADSSGYRGSFLKPLRNLFEIFVEVPRSLRAGRVLTPGEAVVISPSEPAATEVSSTSESIDLKIGQGGWEDERALDEPDSSWCLREYRSSHCKHSEKPLEAKALDEEPDIEADEEVMIFRARPGVLGGTPDTLCFDNEERDRSKLLRCVSLASATHRDRQTPPSSPLASQMRNARSEASEGASRSDQREEEAESDAAWNARISSEAAESASSSSSSVAHLAGATHPGVDRTTAGSGRAARDGRAERAESVSLSASSVRAAAAQFLRRVGSERTAAGSRDASARSVTEPTPDLGSEIEPGGEALRSTANETCSTEARRTPCDERSCSASSCQAPSYQMSETRSGHLELSVCFPLARRAGDLSLDICETSARVASAFRKPDGQHEVLEMSLPFEVNPNSAVAHFKKNQRQLIVRLSRKRQAALGAEPSQ